jgi:hypothetical protein
VVCAATGSCLEEIKAIQYFCKSKNADDLLYAGTHAVWQGE